MLLVLHISAGSQSPTAACCLPAAAAALAADPHPAAEAAAAAEPACSHDPQSTKLCTMHHLQVIAGCKDLYLAHTVRDPDTEALQ